MYTIGQVSKMYKVLISTLRYYDKVVLFHNLERNGGIRKISNYDLDAIRVIECLKLS